MLKAAVYRFYQNFLMSSRLAEYERLMSKLVEQGYCFITIADLARRNGGAIPARTCIVRVDVDSDLPTAREMFRIKRALGITSTYYFRLSTLDPELMKEISACGSEVGYHYEELATVAKRLGLCNKAEIDNCILLIRDEFKRNIQSFSAQAGALPRTIASHGDWVNRKLRLPNHYFADRALCEAFGITAEAYDPRLNAQVKARFSDADAPAWWRPEPPSKAVTDGVSCIYLLVHPRQWRANRLENLRLDIERVIESILYSWRCKAKGNVDRYQGLGKKQE
ncbi:MAG: hypothetical protein JO009_01590 [Candidatus Eremiobacteraeota bacterium]|nr:hypothetical protein [Candidatus Eremiobacteraeota bacterium]